MITQYGMSETLGLMSTASVQHEYLEGQAYMDCSQDTAALVDREVQTLLNRCYNEALAALRENRELLDEIALYLLSKETITGDELMSFVNASKDPQPAAEETSEE
jgi:cell division protease FtsH